MSSFKERLKKARENKNISLTEFAELCGWSRPRVVHYEEGTREPDFASIQKMAALLNVTASFLAFGENSQITLANHEIGYKIFPILPVEEIDDWIKYPVLTDKHTQRIKIPMYSTQYSDNAFLTEIKGNALIFQDDIKNSLFEGEVGLFDPELLPQHNDFVLIENDGNKMIRKMIQDGSQKFFASRSTPHGDIPYNDATIKGVLVLTTRHFKKNS